MAGIELVADRETRAEFPWHHQVGRRVCRLARDHGVFLRPLGDVLVLMPPLAITEGQLARLLDVVEICVAEVTGG